MVATLGKLNRVGVRPLYGLALALLWVLAVGPFSPASAQTSMEKRQARRTSSPFNLNAGPNTLLQGNLVQCGINNEGDVCTDVFDSPTGGGGFWPSGTTNQYIFNSGLQIAGIIGDGGLPGGPVFRQGDTVAAYFFDARGTQAHGAALTDVFNSLNPNDLANWPEGAIVSDTAIFNAALIGSRVVSDQDSYVEYWDGDPNRLGGGRSNPMGIKVQQRSLAFNAPSGAEHTIFFIYRFTNVTNDPAFQQANEARFNVNLPDAGYTIDSIYAAFAMDPDVTTHAGDNFATAILPLNMGIAYHALFQTDDFNFAARADLYAPPFFQGPGFVGVKYLRSPAGLSMFSNTTNGGTFPDPQGPKQLFRYLKGDVRADRGDPVCTVGDSETAMAMRLCALVQTRADARFFQSSGPFSLAPGESSTIVVAYTHAAPVMTPGYVPGNQVTPGVPSTLPGVGGNPIRQIEQMAGWIQTPASAVVGDPGEQIIDESQLVAGRDFVRRSLVHHGLIAQSIYNNKFLLPRPPETPSFSLVPGDQQVTIVWAPSATDVNCVEGPGGQGGDPFYVIASDPESPLFNPNYRRCDVEGYRIYRATGLSGGFEQIAQFDKIGSFITDVTCELDPEFVPEEGDPCTASDIELRGDIVMFFEGGRVRNAVTGSVQLLPGGADTISLQDTGVPFAFIDRNVRNGITYRYQVSAFDVNSLRSGSISLESPRIPQFVTPRKDPSNLVFASFSSSVSNADGEPLPNIPEPTINSQTGIFSGPQPPTNGLDATFSPLVERLLPAFSLSATIDSILPYHEVNHPSGVCPNGSNIQGVCWRVFMTFVRDGVTSSSVSDGFTPAWTAFGEPVNTTFPLGSGVVPPDPAAAAQFGLPADFPGFIANVVGTFPVSIIQSQMEGQANRRDAVLVDGSQCPNQIYPGFGCGNRHVSGGSRWFSGANETEPDPTALIRVGHLDGVDSVWAPIHHSPTVSPGVAAANGGGYTTQYAASTAMQCFPYIAGQLGRAADIRVTWDATGSITAHDVSHNVPVIFKPTVQASWGFVTDGNGNGVIDWNDFDYVENIAPIAEGIGFCLPPTDPAEYTQLTSTATPSPVSFQGGADPATYTAQGTGFGLYINGERYIFAMPGGALPAAGTTWTVRTYTGILRTTGGTLTSDPSGYSWRGDLEPRQPMVPGLTFNAESQSATGPEGDVDITNVHTVPDPYYVRSAFELGPSNKALRFVNLPPQAIIRIYTLNGTLVKVIEHNDPLGGAEAQWDLRNRNNQFVASGVYFFVVEAANGKKHTGKFTVVQFAR